MHGNSGIGTIPVDVTNPSPPHRRRPGRIRRGLFFSPFGHRLPAQVILILHSINIYNILLNYSYVFRSAFFNPPLVEPTSGISEGHQNFYTMALLAPAMNVTSIVSLNVLENVSLKETHAPN
jgi:hypothetical protein